MKNVFGLILIIVVFVCVSRSCTGEIDDQSHVVIDNTPKKDPNVLTFEDLQEAKRRYIERNGR